MPLPPSPTSSTTEHADDMSGWLEGVGISDGLGSDEGEIPSETESTPDGGLEELSEWLSGGSEGPLGGLSESEPEYGSEGPSEDPSESPSESGPESEPRSGSEGPSDAESSLHDTSMPDAPSIPSPSTDSLRSHSTAEYGSLHFSFEDSDWNIMALTRPILASLNGSREMSPPPPPPPPPLPLGPWDDMDGIEFTATIPTEEPLKSPWKEEAGNTFIGTGSGDEGEDSESSGPGSLDESPTNSGFPGSSGEERFRGGRSRVGSLAEGSEVGDWVEGSWEDEEVILVGKLWGEHSE